MAVGQMGEQMEHMLAGNIRAPPLGWYIMAHWLGEGLAPGATDVNMADMQLVVGRLCCYCCTHTLPTLPVHLCTCEIKAAVHRTGL